MQMGLKWIKSGLGGGEKPIFGGGWLVLAGCLMPKVEYPSSNSSHIRIKAPLFKDMACFPPLRPHDATAKRQENVQVKHGSKEKGTPLETSLRMILIRAARFKSFFYPPASASSSVAAHNSLQSLRHISLSERRRWGLPIVGCLLKISFLLLERWAFSFQFDLQIGRSGAFALEQTGQSNQGVESRRASKTAKHVLRLSPTLFALPKNFPSCFLESLSWLPTIQLELGLSGAAVSAASTT